MKKIILTALFAVAAVCNINAQRGFNFQGVSQQKNAEINVVFEFINTYDDEVTYSEQHTVKTNADGVFCVVMGEGTPLTEGRNFAWVHWANNNYKLRTSINGEVVSTTEFHAVPYAKVAEELACSEELIYMAYEMVRNSEIGWMPYDNRERINMLEITLEAVVEEMRNIAPGEVTVEQVQDIVNEKVDMLRAQFESKAADIETKLYQVIDNLEGEKAEVQQNINALKTYIDNLVADTYTLQAEVNNLKNENESMKYMIEALQEQIEQLKNAIGQ